MPNHVPAAFFGPRRVKAYAGMGALALACFAGAPAIAQPYDLSEVRAIAQSAITGTPTVDPVPGFELLIMHEGQVILHESFGAWTNGRIANADSSTKTLAGGLIVSLAHPLPGQSSINFSLDTRLSEYIPEFDGPQANITIRQAFSHTSGLRAQNTAVGSTTLTLQQAAVSIANSPLAAVAPPGTEFLYGGVSMHAAGAVAERAAGAPWNTLFAQRITGPLGMTATRFSLTTPTNPRIAGGCESNAAEFARFMEMVRRGGLHATPQGDVRVLSVAAVEAMLTRQSPLGIPVTSTPYGDDGDYGVGIWLDERTPSGALIGAIAGGARGFGSWIDLDDHVTGVISTDTTSFSNVAPIVESLRRAVERAVRPPCLADFDQDGGVTGADIEAFFGAFEVGDPSGDADGDGGITGADVEAFFLAFQSGC
jgi:hypothetical protein